MKRLSTVVALLLLVACAEDRYRWNLAHAWVNPRTPLPRKDIEEVVRLVSYATNEPIGAINVLREFGRIQVDVLTATIVSTHTFMLEKHGSTWHIMSKTEQPEIE